MKLEKMNSGQIVASGQEPMKEWVLESVKQWVDEDPDMSMDDVVTELYNSELNYNNADKTSGQTVFTRQELESEVENALDYLKEDDDRCSGCGKIIPEEDYVSEQNLCTNDPYPIYENIVTGYKCDSCGHMENY